MHGQVYMNVDEGWGEGGGWASSVDASEDDILHVFPAVQECSSRGHPERLQRCIRMHIMQTGPARGCTTNAVTTMLPVVLSASLLPRHPVRVAGSAGGGSCCGRPTASVASGTPPRLHTIHSYSICTQSIRRTWAAGLLCLQPCHVNHAMLPWNSGYMLDHI